MDKKIAITIVIIAASLAVIPITTAEAQVLEEIKCVTCHQQLPISHAEYPENIRCETCHGILSTKLTELAINHQRIIDTTTKSSLSCKSCHQQTLGVHSSLGVGSQACLVCHDSFQMRPHTLNGTLLSDTTTSTALCANCHRERYADWKIGIHGTHGLNQTATKNSTLACVVCHNPHTPDLPEINALPSPERPERSTALLSVLVPPAAVLLAGAVIVTMTVTRRKEGVE